MSPEREKMLRDNFGWSYEPSCPCGNCVEYRKEVFYVDRSGGVTPTRPHAPSIVPLPPRDESKGVYVSDSPLRDAFADFAGMVSDKVQGTARDKTSAERKAEPIYSGVLRYFPDALAAVSRVSKAGNDKHNPGQPLHWSRGKSTDHLDCAIRHALTPERIDAECQEPELALSVWRGLAQLQLLEEKRNRERGIRSYSEAA